MSSTTKKTSLLFPSVAVLWQFAKTLGNKTISIDTFSKTLNCYCTPVDLQRALDHYQAQDLL